MVNRLSKSKKRPISTRTRIAFNRAHTYHDRQKNLKIPVQPKAPGWVLVSTATGYKPSLKVISWQAKFGRST